MQHIRQRIKPLPSPTKQLGISRLKNNPLIDRHPGRTTIPNLQNQMKRLALLQREALAIRTPMRRFPRPEKSNGGGAL